MIKLQVKNNFGDFEDLNDTKIYNVTTNSYLAGGGRGFTRFKDDRIDYMKGDLATDVLKEYIDHKCPLEVHSQPRIGMVCGIRKIKNEHIEENKPEFLCDIPDPVLHTNLKGNGSYHFGGFSDAEISFSNANVNVIENSNATQRSNARAILWKSLGICAVSHGQHWDQETNEKYRDLKETVMKFLRENDDNTEV